jgi:hypothetical protein
MNEELIGSLIDKVDKQERKMEELKVKAEVIPSYIDVLSQVKIGMEGLRTDVQKISFPENKIGELFERLAKSIGLFEKPVTQKITHHHHISKIIWATATLFLVLCLVSAGWYSTYNKLDYYKANDTKYRYLKLEANRSLGKWLNMLDSLYIVNTKMRDEVIQKEERKQRDFEIMQQALQMEKEAKELMKKVKKKGN